MVMPCASPAAATASQAAATSARMPVGCSAAYCSLPGQRAPPSSPGVSGSELSVPVAAAAAATSAAMDDNACGERLVRAGTDDAVGTVAAAAADDAIAAAADAIAAAAAEREASAA